MTRFGTAVARIDEREPGTTLPLLSVSQTRGVLRRSEISDKPPRAESLDVYKICRKGDIVFNKMSIRAGAMGVAREDGLVTYHYEVMRPKQNSDARFLVYVMKSDWFTGELIARERGIGAGDQGGSVRTTEVPFTVLRTIEAFVPALDMQVAIADFLDRETAQIDTLITKQEQLIETLRERREAVVRAGTGWGRLLQGWTIERLSWIFRSTGSGTTPAVEDVLDHADADFPWVTTSELREIPLATTSFGVARETLARYSALKVIPPGSLLVAMYGATIGRTALLEVSATCNQACCALIGADRSVAQFVQYSLQAARDRLLLNSAGGGQPNINQEKLRSFRIPMPPSHAVRQIVDELDAQTSAIDRLISRAEQFVLTATERRSALITAAVTGQLDVSKAA